MLYSVWLKQGGQCYVLFTNPLLRFFHINSRFSRDIILLTLLRYFDYMLLLKKGGKTVYFGPTGDNCQEMLRYFSDIQILLSLRGFVA